MRVRVGPRATVRVRVRVAEGSRAGWAIGHRHLLHLGGVVVGESAQRELVPHLHHATRKGTWRRVVVGVGAAVVVQAVVAAMEAVEAAVQTEEAVVQDRGQCTCWKTGAGARQPRARARVEMAREMRC